MPKASDNWLSRATSIREFLRAGSASVLIQVFNRLIMLSVGVILARWLGPTEYGYYAYAFAWLAVGVVLADLGIGQWTLRECARLRETAELENTGQTIWTGALTVLLLSVSVALIGLLVLGNITSTPQSLVLAVVIMLLPITLLVRYWSYGLRGLGRITQGQLLDQIFVPLLVLAGIVLIITLQAHPSARLAVNVQIVAAMVAAVTGLVALVRLVPMTRVRPSAMFALVPAALPFGILAGINILNGQIDLLMLGYFTSAEQVGFYRIAVLGAALVGFGLQAANVVLPTLFARLQAQDNQTELQSLVTLSAQAILASALPVALVFWLWGEFIITQVFGVPYVHAYGPLVILVVGELVGASMGSLGFLLYMSGEERRALAVLGGTAALNVLLNLLLIPEYGMVGAAIATALGQGLRVVLLYWLVVRRLNLSPSPFRARSGH